ncbi:MAG TPA: ribonuclease P protein component [Buchnera sp. (in: enterobacteria)]|nr:ribonuclease P protein component [Buchnera sp. (in: enterobacteria)]
MRLLNRKDFNYVFLNPKRIAFKELVLLSRKNDTFQHSRIGIIISKKNIKKSNERNRIKRLVRETFRISQNILLVPMDHVLIIKKSSMDLDNSKLMNLLKKLWKTNYLLK